MLSHNNWINHNLKERLISPEISFKYLLKPTKNKILSFHEAADFTATLIATKWMPIYVGLSGGCDSEYVVRTFHRLKIPFNVLIVETSGNQQELKFAFHLCKELDIIPLIFKCSDTLFLNIARRDIIGKLSSYEYNNVASIIGASVAYKNNGIFISGDHLIPDGIASTTAPLYGYDIDYVYDISYPGYGLAFYCYTIEIVRAMINSLDDSPEEEWKCSLYNIGYRPKYRPIYDQKMQNDLLDIVKERKYISNPACLLGTKEEVLAMFDSWNK